MFDPARPESLVEMARIKIKQESPHQDPLEDLLTDQPEDACTVQVVGLYQYVPASVFQNYFSLHAINHQAPPAAVVSVFMEENFKRNERNCLTPEKQLFIEFMSEADSNYVLGLQRVHMMVSDRSGALVEFQKPIENTATRAAKRKVFELKKRISEIKEEYKTMGAVTSNPGKPTLPVKFQNKTFFMQAILACERKRKAGKELDYHEYNSLTHYVLKDTDKLNARIDVLYNEECDAWLALRKYELAGLNISD